MQAIEVPTIRRLPSPGTRRKPTTAKTARGKSDIGYAGGMPDHGSLLTTEQFNAGLADLRGEVRTEIAAVRVEVASLDKRLTGKIAELRNEVRAGFADLRNEIVGVRAAIARLGEQLARTETHRPRWTRRTPHRPVVRAGLGHSPGQPVGPRRRRSERTASTSA